MYASQVDATPNDTKTGKAPLKLGRRSSQKLEMGKSPTKIENREFEIATVKNPTAEQRWQKANTTVGAKTNRKIG